MDSDEFVAFIGHNYDAPVPVLLPLLNFDGDTRSFNTEEVMGEPLSPASQARMREQVNIILNNGSIQAVTGPEVDGSSHGSPPEVCSHPPSYCYSSR